MIHRCYIIHQVCNMTLSVFSLYVDIIKVTTDQTESDVRYKRVKSSDVDTSEL